MAKKASAAVSIEIPPLQTEEIIVRVVGDTPLIVHRFGKKARDEMAGVQQGKAKQKKPPKDPKACARDCLYVIPKRHGKPERYGFPAAGFRKACVRAANLCDVPMTQARQLLRIMPVEVEDGNMIPLEYERLEECHEDPVRLNGKKADLRYRPYFHGWSAMLKITYLANVITAGQIVNLLNTAGFAVGIGDWRPEKDGSNGCFHVESSGK